MNNITCTLGLFVNLSGILDMIRHPSCAVSLMNQFLYHINSKDSQNIRMPGREVREKKEEY